ncbi:MAG: hypothetical protein RMK74_12980 [Myxococcales bacterium]|nr:hypothetical protein [Myxococcales bacterium]
MSVTLAPGAADNGFASMLAALIAQNLDAHPELRALLAHMEGRVAIVVEDAEVSVTLQFDRVGVTLHDGIRGIPDVTIRGSADDITRTSRIERLGRLGLPDPRGMHAREALRALRDRRLRIYGALGSPLLLARLTRLLSVD